MTAVSGDTSVATVSGGDGSSAGTLTFTADDWRQPQTLTVTAVDDAVDNEGGLRTTGITHQVGADYPASSPPELAVTVRDDEMTVVTSRVELAVDEAGPGATAAYTVRLGERPRSRFTYLSVTPVDGQGASIDPPDWITFDADTRTFTGTPREADTPDTLTIRVTATDGALTDTTTFKLTVKAVNDAPEFTEGDTAARSLVELIGAATETTARDVGDPVTATDPDSETLTYALTGTDASAFAVVAAGGQLRTKIGQSYDYETKRSYTVTVTVTDEDGADDSIAVTIGLTDVPAPAAPGAPTVKPGTDPTRLAITWTAPENTGLPPITGYDLQYRKQGTEDWTDGPQGRTGTSATLSGLTASTSYEVEVRASSAEGDGEWSATGSGATADPVVTIAADAASVTEGGSAAFTVTASAAPPAALEVPLTVAATGEFGYGANTGAQTVTLSADETTAAYTLATTGDRVDEANGAVTVTVHAGADYTLGSPVAATVTVNDDDDAGVTVDPTALTVAEAGGTDSYTVVLTSQPTVTVTIAVSSDDAGAATVDKDSLTFTTAAWNTAQTVTVTGQNDDADNTGDKRTAIVSHAVTSADAAYGAVTPRSVTVTDDEGEVIITSLNQPPMIGDATDQTTPANEPFSYQAPMATDPDNDLITYTASLEGGGALPGWLSFDAAARTFGGTPLEADAPAVLDIVVSATDGELTDTTTFTLTVVEVNDAPAFAAEATDRTATEDVPFTYDIPAPTDPEGDEMTCEAVLADGSALPGWLSFDGHVTFSGTPLEADTPAVLDIVVTVGDDASPPAVDTTSFTLTVVKVNDAPVFAAEATDQTATEDVPFSYEVPAAVDPDSDPITYAATLEGGGALPGWLSFDATARTFGGTPLEADAPAVLEVVVSATDGELTDTMSFTLTVEEVNDAPVFEAEAADRTAIEDVPFRYQVPAAVDPEGDTLTYAAHTAGGPLPGWLSFDPETRTFSGTPRADDAGAAWSIEVSATDGELTAVTVFTLTVQEAGDSRLPRAAQQWLARFGRTVAGHVAAPIGDRLAGAGNELVVAGQPLDFSAAAAADDSGRRPGDSYVPGEGWSEPWNEPTFRSLTVDELLTGSSFRVSLSSSGSASSGSASSGSASSGSASSGSASSGSASSGSTSSGSTPSESAEHGSDGDGGAGRWTAWGEAAATSFAGEADGLSLGGAVVTGVAALDWERDGWLLGLAVSRSAGSGTYAAPAAGALDAIDGTAEASLTGAHPYARFRPGAGLEFWGVLGHGRGTMALATDEEEARPGIWMSMAGVGGSGALLSADANGGPALRVTGDALAARTESAAAGDLAEAVSADTTRVRLGLAGSWGVPLGGGLLTPALQAALRHDGGHAETGFGLDLGGGFEYADAGLGLTVSLNGRALLTHEDGALREWGARGSLRYDLGGDGLGPTLSLTPSWDASAGDTSGRLEGEAGYGFAALGGVLTPYGGMTLAEDARDWRVGGRLALGSSFGLGLEGTRRESGTGSPEHGVTLRIEAKW